MSPDLFDYLRKMTTPEEGVIIRAGADFDWSVYPDSSVHSVVLTDASEVEEAYRVLKPGGHLMLASPEEDPSGYRGACAAEDIGFEVRDALLLIEGSGEFHYVAKPPTKEKEAGLATLSEREESSERKNIHPTVKPAKVMERLMDDLPREATVVDPFFGSGTTGIAALRTGRSLLGIEMEPGYLEIADARMRHWREAEAGWKAVVIDSDLDPEADEDTDSPVDMDDFFGL
jgi:SAM-dependent methyltransferase